MLEAVLSVEQEVTQHDTERAKQAEEFGDKGLAVQLKNMVRDESSYAEGTVRITRDWSLSCLAFGRDSAGHSKPAACEVCQTKWHVF